jgi:acetylornithine deacetylase/succinyl-diaminopimelate desuccinylase-like protein
MKEIFEHIDSHTDARLRELFEWLRIPSVSADPAFAGECRRAAAWLQGKLLAAGMTAAELVETGGHPAVYAEWLGAKGAPTVLCYGHYDVQPAVLSDGWKSEPFEPVVRDGFLFGRGTADDKGQVHMHLAAVESLMKVRGKLPCNVKFIVEGEEEGGSEHTESLIRSNAKRLACDVLLVSDSPMFAEGYPSLCVGLRGLAYGEVVVDGPRGDLHSGSFGGGVTNPANALARLLAGLHDADGRVAIPHFYDDVVEITAAERKALDALPFDEKAWLATTGSPAPAGEKGYGTLARIWARPTCDVNGMVSGYTGEGAKTIVPRRASAKVSTRLVANQKPERIMDLLERYFVENAPASVKVSFLRHHTGQPYLGDTKGPAFVAAKAALSAAFGRETVEIREGGSIPIVATFAEVLKAPCVLMGFGLPDQNIHGPNENLKVENHQKGTRAVAAFFQEMAKKS